MMTGSNMQSILPGRDHSTAPTQLMFHHEQGKIPHQCRWPMLERHCLFRVLPHERLGNAEIWLWHSAGEILDFEPQACHVSCQTGHLVRVGTGRDDGGHEADSPFHALPKIEEFFENSTVVLMGVDTSINEVHFMINNNSWRR